MRTTFALAVVACVLATGCTTTDLAETTGLGIRSGRWHAWIETPGGDLPFGLEVAATDSGAIASLVNGDERLEIPNVYRENEEIVFDIEHYDAGLRGRANITGTRVDGTWWRRLAEESWVRLPFHAEHGARPRFAAAATPSGGDAVDPIDGSWVVQWDLRADDSVALFKTLPDGVLQGTFINSTGDYRYLAGQFDGNRLRLSRFDGAHAFLFDARLLSDRTLEGRFWEGDYIQDAWIAWRDDEAATPDPFGQFRWSDALDLDSLTFVDLAGAARTLGDDEFRGRGLILEIMGTWCPNCHDATAVLDELYERYRDDGLSVVGLAFEMTEDLERNARLLTRYRSMNQVSYPMLLAAADDSGSPSEVFEGVEGMFAFPTVMFIHGDGRIRAIHTGFTGPATGEAYVQLRARFEALAQELVSVQ